MGISPTTRKTELRLFISSTFRDLQAEREYLIKKVFPELRALCRERGVTFTEVDLRWGLTDEQQRLGRIIRTCLEEIDRCRPFFIGIIGERYGWIPEYHEVMMDPEIQERYPWIESLSLEGASILEMEFTHGVLNGGGDSAYFYHRIAPGADSDNPDRMRLLLDRLEALSRPIRSFKKPEELGEEVRKDLLAIINETWPPNEIPTPLEEEALAHESFAHSRRRAYIPNPEYLTRFNEWLKTGKKPLVISAGSGMGKSALLAWLIGEYRRRNSNAFIIEQYIGASDDSTDHIGFIRRVMGEIKERYTIEDAIPSDTDELERSFPEWLARVGSVSGFEKDELVIALDAVDQLMKGSRTFSWLPMSLPEKVHLVISAQTGETLDRLLERNWERLELRELKEREREAIVARYLGEYHKELPGGLLQKIGNDPKASSPLFLRTLAEELRLYGEHESIAKAVERYLAARDLDDLFIRALERMEQDYGADVVCKVTATLACSRAGLKETRLLGASGVLRVDLSMLLHALDYHLLRAGGRINFFHNYLRRAVEERYLPTDESKRTVHRSIGEFFKKEFETEFAETNGYDPAVIREMLYQFSRADNRDELRGALLAPPIFSAMFEGETEYEFLRYWKMLGDHDIAALYEKAFASEKEPELLLKLCRLYRAVGDWEQSEKKLQEVVALSSATGHEHHLLSALSALGDLEMLRGKTSQAYETFTKQLALAKKLGDEDAEADASGDIGAILVERGEYDGASECFDAMLRTARSRNDKRLMTRALLKIGQIHLAKGEYDKAMPAYRECYELLEPLGAQREMAFALGQIGLVYWNSGEFEKAMDCFREEMESMETIGDSHGRAMARGKIGLVQLDRGDLESASDSFETYLALTGELGYSRGMGFAYGDIGIVRSRRGEIKEALEYFEKALAVHREIDFPFGIAMWLRWKAETILDGVQKGMFPVAMLTEATSCNDESNKLSRSIESKDTLFDSEIAKARLLAATTGAEAAKKFLTGLLTEMDGDAKQAAVHYWLWKLSAGDTKDTARELYRSLAERTKKSLFLTRLKELGG
jgi:tetratricopeptide (TPR) repeat protein